jgi:hypothetical protein
MIVIDLLSLIAFGRRFLGVVEPQGSITYGEVATKRAARN